LLRESEKSVKEIGLSVGFKRAEAFSKAFKKLMGCSPRHFRGAGNASGGTMQIAPPSR
jgi:AraC-like DNA-binding protein